MLEEHGLLIALLDDETNILHDEQSALDLIGELSFNKKARHLVIPAEALNKFFFDLSTGLAGNILQKFVNYKIHLAIIGDFSIYNSKNLHQFILESNKSNHVVFAASIEEAIEKFLS